MSQLISIVMMLIVVELSWLWDLYPDLKLTLSHYYVQRWYYFHRLFTCINKLVFSNGLQLLTNRIYQGPNMAMVDKFMMDIRRYTASVSGCTSPDAIILVGVSYYSHFSNGFSLFSFKEDRGPILL